MDNDVHKYIFSVAKWYIGNLVWSFETPRYFGAERDEVKKTLVVNVKNHGHDIDSEINEKCKRRMRLSPALLNLSSRFWINFDSVNK